MSEQWQYQVRIDLADEPAALARRNPADPALAPLPEILRRHNAILKSQYDAFAGYVAEAEREGIEKYPLYHWTKATIENPAKKTKYQKSFTLYVDGDEVYAKAQGGRPRGGPAAAGRRRLVTRLAKHDTNPANNPQPPARYRK